MNKDELKDLVRTEPNVSSTFKDVDTEFHATFDHVVALYIKRRELSGKLKAIDDAKAELAKPTDKPAEKPADSPASQPAKK